MLRKVGLALGWLGYAQVVPSDSIPTYEIGPIVVAERYGVAPVYRLEPSRQLGASTLQATFERVPGVFWMGTSAHGGRPVLRGLSYQRVLLLYHHLPRDGDYWGEDHGYEVASRYFFLRPEIRLGPQAVRYGSGAMGGVLNYHLFLPDSTTFLGQLQTLYNPLGGSGQVGYLSRLSSGAIATEGGFQRLSSYIEPSRGAVWNTALQEAYGGLLTEKSWQAYTLKAWTYYFSQRLGLPPEDWDPQRREWLLENGDAIPARAAQSFLIDRPYQHIQNLTTGMEVLRFSSQAVSTWRLSYLYNDRQEYGYGADEPDVWLRNHRLATEWTWTHAAYQGGVTGTLAYRTDAGSAPFAPTALSYENGIWGRYRYPVRRGQWQIGLRLHYGQHQNRNTRAARHYLTWAAEVSYETPTYWLKLARSFRLPHPVELWADGFHEGARRYELGRPTLPTETAYSVETRLAYKAFALQTYLMYFPQYIFFQRLEDTLISAIGATFQYTAKSALLTGFEVAYQKDWLSVELSYVHGYFPREKADSLRAMPKIPPFRVRFQLQWPKALLQPYVETAFYAPQRRAFTAYRTEIPTPGYAVVNGGVRFLRRRWSLTFGGTNLLNVRYQSHLSLFRQWGPDGIYAPGRGFYLRMEWL